MPPPSPEPPVFLIVAGPNGSGKTSAYLTTDIEAAGRSVWIINPDLLLVRIRDGEKRDGTITIDEKALPAVVEAARRTGTQG